MNWSELSGEKRRTVGPLAKVSQFRARHPAIGAGVQQSQQTANYYAFSRQHQGDKVLVVWVGDKN